MKLFKALRIHETGCSLDEVEIRDNPEEILIRVEYSSINYKDVLAASGAVKIVRKFPLTAGTDAYGIVERSSDEGLPVGSGVIVTGQGLGESHDGGYAEYLSVPSSWALPLPDGLTGIEAMALGTAGLTVALAIHKLELNGLSPAEGPVAVTGATGGVGSLAVAILSRLGYEVTAVTGKAASQDFLRRLGAADILPRSVTQDGDRPLLNQRWAAALDSVGGDTLSWLMKTMSQEASIAVFGNVSGNDLKANVLPFLLRAINLLGVNAAHFDLQLREHLWKRLASDMFIGDKLPLLTSTVNLEHLPETLEKFSGSQVTGRILVKVGSQPNNSPKAMTTSKGPSA